MERVTALLTTSWALVGMSVERFPTSWGGAAYHFEKRLLCLYAVVDHPFLIQEVVARCQRHARPKCYVSWLCIHQRTPRSSKLAALLCGAPPCSMLTLAADLQIHDGVVNELLGVSGSRVAQNLGAGPRTHWAQGLAQGVGRARSHAYSSCPHITCTYICNICI